MNASGMIVKINRKTCIVLTAGGEYKEVSLPGEGIPRLGQEIKLESGHRLPYLKQFMAVASLFIILLAGMLYLGETPPAAAYLSIDINPSIELAVSSAGKVISAHAMDDEGEKILEEIKVKGKDLREAVGLIVAQAVTDNYIVESGDNVILATLTVASGAEPLVDLDSVYEAIKNQVELSGVQSDVIIEPVEPELRQEAVASGLSTGKYLLLNESDKKGLEISLNDITSMSLGKLEKEKKLDLVDLVADGDNGSGGNDSPPGQENKAAKRGIYVERQKTAGVQGKPAGKVPVTDEKQADNDVDAGSVNEKALKGNGEVKHEGNGEAKHEDNGEAKHEDNGNKGQDNGKTGDSSDNGENDKHDR